MSLVIETLLDKLPADDHATVISVKQDNMPNSPSTNGQNSSASQPRYDPTVAYILEFSTLLATRDSETVKSSAKQVFDTVQGILRDSSRWHAITVSRATFYALKILRASYVSLLYASGGAWVLTRISKRRTTTLPTYRSCFTQSRASLRRS